MTDDRRSSEDQTGPNEQQLKNALSAAPGQIEGAGDAWRTAAEGLTAVAQELTSARAEIAQARPGGTGGQAATAAFARLSTQVADKADRMDMGAAALDTAALALKVAKGDHAALHPPPLRPGRSLPMPRPRRGRRSLRSETLVQRRSASQLRVGPSHRWTAPSRSRRNR